MNRPLAAIFKLSCECWSLWSENSLVKILSIKLTPSPRYRPKCVQNKMFQEHQITPKPISYDSKIFYHSKERLSNFYFPTDIDHAKLKITSDIIQATTSSQYQPSNASNHYNNLQFFLIQHVDIELLNFKTGISPWRYIGKILKKNFRKGPWYDLSF